MKKNSAFISLESPPYGGGAGVYFYMLCYRMQQDFEFYTHFRSRKILKSKARYMFFPCKLWFLFAPFILFIIALMYRRVIINDPPFIYASGFMPSFLLNRITIIIHGRERRWETPSILDKIFLFRLMFKRGILNSKNVIFVSEYIKDIYLKEYNLDAKYRIIHNGVKSNKKLIEKEKKENHLRLITVCRLTPGKNVLGLFLDIKDIIADNDIFWDIYGTGEEYHKIKNIILKYGLENKIILHGYLESSKLPKVYKECDCFILDSKLEESFGLVYLEAASHGCFIIGNTDFGAKEALRYVDNFTKYSKSNIAEVISIVYKKKKVSNQCLRNIDDVVLELNNDKNIIF